MVLALDRVNADGTGYSMGQGPSVLNGGPHTMQSNAAAAAGRLSGVSQGWDTVRRAFNSHGGDWADNNLSHLTAKTRSGI